MTEILKDESYRKYDAGESANISKAFIRETSPCKNDLIIPVLI